VAPAQIASWRDGRLMVDNVTVADVVEEFRRYYPGVILLRDQRLAARRVTGVFDLHDPVAGLRAVLQPYGGHLTTITPWLLLVSGDG
jgi:transmembrane sensor